MTFNCNNWNRDFERYRHPPVYFGTRYPVTIHLAGDSRKSEMKSFQLKENEKWKVNIVVDDTQFHTLRLGLSTELSCKATSQQDKLQGLLKDHPVIPSAIAPSEQLRVDTIPALTSIRDNERETDIVGYIPGDLSVGMSLKRDCNIVPIPKLYYASHTAT